MRGFNLAATVSIASFLLLGLTSPANAFHLFRGDENGGCGMGCCPATAELSDDPEFNGVRVHGPITAEVAMLHNTFNDSAWPSGQASRPGSH